MAIQFLCPHCSATITVPNSSHGKRGSCPACKQKLIVPRPLGDPPSTIPLGSQPAPTVAAAPVTEQMPAAPAMASPVANDSPFEQTPPVIAEPPAAVSTEQDPAVPRPLQAEAPKSVAATMGRRRKKRRTSPLLTIGIPIACFVAFIGVLAFIFTNSQPELKGTITGAALTDFELPTGRLSLSGLSLQESDSATVADVLQNRPERFISTMMKCTVGAEGQRLTVDVEPNDDYQWFTVNPVSDANLADWVKRNSGHWNEQRQSKVQEVATEFCQQIVKRAAGQREAFDAAKFRDGFALPNQVKGFGYLVEAIADSQRAVCAHEDSNGTLYFCLPTSVTTFVLQGRAFGNQAPAFPGSYTVTVTASNEAGSEAEAVEPVDNKSSDADADVQQPVGEPDGPGEAESPGMSSDGPMMNQ